MEFLMTYGWAILVVLAAIGALAYFGVLSPDKFLPDKCTISPPISCLEYKANATNVIVNLQQDSGNALNIVAVQIERCTALSNATTAALNNVQNNAKTGVLTLSCAGMPSAGSKFKGSINVTYQPTDGAIARSVSGSIQTKVE